MVLRTQCYACQTGDHDNHYKVVQAVPEGVMGGAICDCKGECRDQPPKPVIELLTPAIVDPAIVKLFSSLDPDTR